MVGEILEERAISLGYTNNTEWKRLQIERFGTALTNAFQILADRFSDNFKLTIEEYDSTVENIYALLASCRSEKVPIYEVEWQPMREIFIFWNIYVNPDYRGKGIGTTVNELTQDMALGLGAKRLIIQDIIPGNLEFWSNRDGYECYGSKFYGMASRLLE
tara:strand:+ start:2162 stop:2641 length:480 start_codon:yes stop_codon:yes gene_type:complete